MTTSSSGGRQMMSRAPSLGIGITICRNVTKYGGADGGLPLECPAWGCTARDKSISSMASPTLRATTVTPRPALYTSSPGSEAGGRVLGVCGFIVSILRIVSTSRSSRRYTFSRYEVGMRVIAGSRFARSASSGPEQCSAAAMIKSAATSSGAAVATSSARSVASATDSQCWHIHVAAYNTHVQAKASPRFKLSPSWPDHALAGNLAKSAPFRPPAKACAILMA
jgi:hypothetical protein